MDAIKILDNYKLSLTEDPIYLRVLSIIALYYKMTEEKLVKLVPELQKHKLVVPELFKAGLIKYKEDETALVLTQKSETILKTMDIDSLVLKEFVYELPLDYVDRIFLLKTLDYFDLSSNYSKDVSSLLRTLTLVSKPLANKKKFKKIIFNNAATIIFHFNTTNLHVSNKTLINGIFLNIDKDYGINQEIKTNIHAKRTRYETLAADSSLNFLWSNCHHLPKHECENNKIQKSNIETTYFLTFLRHWNLNYHSFCDSELYNLTRQCENAGDPVIVIPFIESLGKVFVDELAFLSPKTTTEDKHSTDSPWIFESYRHLKAKLAKIFHNHLDSRYRELYLDAKGSDKLNKNDD